MAKYEHPHKCRCGKWLYNRAAARGYCAQCGPTDDHKPIHEPWCAALVERECSCGALDAFEDGIDHAMEAPDDRLDG